MISKAVVQKTIETIKKQLLEDERKKPKEISDIKEQLARLGAILRQVNVGTSIHAISTLTFLLATETKKPNAYILALMIYFKTAWKELRKAGIL